MTWLRSKVNGRLINTAFISMILITDSRLGAPRTGLPCFDIVADVAGSRVFLETGLSEQEAEDAMKQFARILS